MKRSLTGYAKWIRLSAALFAVGCIFLLHPAQAFAGSCTSVGAANWSSASTWGVGCGTGGTAQVPTAADNVTINTNVTIPTGDSAVATALTVNSGKTLTITSTGNLTMSGNLLDNGIIAGTGPLNLTGSGTTLDGTGTITMSGLTTITNNKTINTGSTLPFSGAMTISTGVTTNNGTTTVTGTLTISSGATWTQGSGSILGVCNATAITATGTFTASTVTNTVEYCRAGAQTGLVTTYDNLSIQGTSAKTFATTPTVNDVMSMEGTATITVTTGVVTYGTGATLQYNTASARTASAEEMITPFLGTGGILIKSTGAITLPAAQQIGDATHNAPLTISAGATLTPSTHLITVFGNLVNNGTITAGSGGLTIAGTNTQSVAGFSTTGVVSMTKTAGTATFTSNMSGGALTINGTGGTLDLGTSLTHVFTGTFTETAGTFAVDTSSVELQGVTSGAGITMTTGTGSTVIYDHAGAQTVPPITFYNLTLGGSGVKTVSTTPTVNNVLSMEGTATITVTTGVVTYGSGATLQYNTATARTASTEEWISPFTATGGIVIKNTGAITTPGVVQIGSNNNSPLNINTSATLTPGANLITLEGNFTNSGTLTSGSGGITIAGTTLAQSIGGFTTTGTVTLTKTAGTATFQGAVNGANLTINGSGGTLDLGTSLTHTFTGNWTMTNGTLLGDSSTLNVAGNGSSTGGTFTAGTGTVNYDAASGTQNVTPLTYNNLTATASAARTLKFSTSGSTTISGTLTITGSSGQLITLTSASPPTTWSMSASTAAVSFADIDYSDNTGSSLCATNSQSTNGNNTSWSIHSGASCSVSPPTVTTDNAGSFPVNAILYGTITSTGGQTGAGTDYGFAYGTSATLATVIATSSLGTYSATGAFTLNINSLSANTTYYYRAYVTNSDSTGFGSILNFNTGNTVPSRTLRLLEGSKIKLIGNKIKLY